MFNPKTMNNFITKKEAENILNVVTKIDEWERFEDGDFWDNRSLSDIKIYNEYNKELGEYLSYLCRRVGQSIKNLYSLDKDVYPDLFQVIRWFPGMEQPPHADDMTDSAEADSYFHHRKFGAIIYLNDDYSGGETYYPQHNFYIKPEIGKLAVHPGDPDHLHGVSKIEGGTRYTLASFWGFEEEYSYL